MGLHSRDKIVTKGTVSLPSLSLYPSVWSDTGEVGILLKFCLKHKKEQVRSTVEEINRKVVLRRESL